MVIDFHIHSSFSFDCFLEPTDLIGAARRSGLDGFAVTDHETMAGLSEIRRLAPDLTIIAGQEVTTSDGDILGLFLKKEITAKACPAEVIEDIRSQGGLAVLAHPYKWPHLTRSPALLKKFDAIEAFNARNNIPFPFVENRLAVQAAKRHRLRVLAGSDAHEAFAVGGGRTVFDFESGEATDKKLKEAILSCNVKLAGSEIFLPVEIISHFQRNIRARFR